MHDAPVSSVPPRCVHHVSSFHELTTARFAGGVNAFCWPRVLPGDFAEVVRALRCTEAIAILDEVMLRALHLSPAGRVAVDQMLADFSLLQGRGLAPVLNCINGYPCDDTNGPVATDVFSFHADSAPIEADTYLCTYFGPSSEGVRNEDVVRRVDIPETRARLLNMYGGADDEGFGQFLTENCYDLHYAARPDAEVYRFGLGNLWRIATDWPGSNVPPCVHRAPKTQPGEARLLLIS
jgi:hypothetical protein